MPFQGLAPEAHMARADSKNPSTTCKGITTSGRPCRRALAASAQNSPASSPGRGRGVVAIAPGSQDVAAAAAGFFCWQHKDQANTMAENANGDIQVIDLQKRSSTDSLAARLGILDLKDRNKKKVQKRHNEIKGGNGPGPNAGQTPTQQSTADSMIPETNTSQSTHPVVRPKKKKERSNLHISLFCCMRRSDIHEVGASPPVRPARRTEMSQRPKPNATAQVPSKIEQQSSSQAAILQRRRSPLSYLPQNAKPVTIALLSTELAKPFTPSDREAGYIYIFMIVPSTSKSKPASSDATALLGPPPSQSRAGQRPSTERQASALLREYSVRASARDVVGSDGRRTIMLKIGRAENVHKRMNQWTRQCGEDIMLVRYYPYIGSSSSPSPSPSPANRRVLSSGEPRKVPLVPRVERLIHLELQEQRVMRQCSGCSKQHREWFEVEATVVGVKAIDDTVRRWVQWGEDVGG